MNAFFNASHLPAIQTMSNMNDTNPVLATALLLTALLCTTGIAADGAPDLSKLSSRAELDALIASSGDVALKVALSDHEDDILAAAKRHPHVKAVIHTIESAPGSYEKINTTPASLKRSEMARIERPVYTPNW